MANRPGKYTTCRLCGRQVGVQRDFDAVPSRPRPWQESRWRLSNHHRPDTKKWCDASREVIPIDKVVVRVA